MSEQIAIKIQGLKKQYRLGQIGGGTLTADLQSWWARIRHKEDPNSKIGTDQRLIGQTFMALNGIDLTIKKGEAIGIIGGNGAGKSTMLKILSRITAPTQGVVDIYGRIASMLEVGTGFSPEMTGRENVYLNGAILGMTKAEIDAKMEDIIEFSEVREFIDTPVKRYSSGMYVKLAFSVAAHLDSEIMIMDEVLAVGDMAFQKKCLDKMRDAATVQGKTVLYVSHNMNTIRQLCDRCVVLDKGRIIYDGDVEEAIGIYMGSGGSVALKRDCSDLKRESFCNGKAKIHTVEICDHREPVIYDDEKLKLKISFQAKDDYRDLLFRMILFPVKQHPLGMTASEMVFEARKGENSVCVQTDVSVLAPGEYSGRLVIYQVNEYGGEAIFDVADPGVIFRKELRESVTNTTTVWKTHAWGHISLPPTEVLDETH